MLFFAIVLALIWGVVFALFLQRTAWGRFLALRRTWIAVVLGVGVDLLIIISVIPFDAWLVVCGIITASSCRTTWPRTTRANTPFTIRAPSRITSHWSRYVALVADDSDERPF